MGLETLLKRGNIPSEVKEAIENELAERKRVEDALRDSEERYRQITKSVTDYIYTVCVKNGCPKETVHGPSCEIVTGYTLEEFNSDPFLWIRMVPQEDWDVVQEQASCILSGHDTQPIEHRILRKDGSIRWVRNTPVPHYDSQGNLISYEGLIRDITDWKRVEEALRKSEEKYRTILENIEEGYYEVDIAGNFTFLNDSLCRILGYSKDEIMGMNNRQYMDGKTASIVYQTFNEVYRTEKSTKAFDWEIIRRNGTKKFVEASVSLKTRSTGEIAGFRGIVRDITERKRIEKALHESKQKYQMLVENMEEGVHLEDAKGNISFINPRMTEMSGYSEEELLGKHWSFITPPEEREKVSKETAKRPHGESSTYETVILTKDGQRIPVINAATPLFSETGTFQGVLSVIIDISEQKKFQQLQERFIATTSHELRTPVTVLMGYIDFLQKNPDQPISKMEQIYQKLHSNVTRLSKLIENVHVLAKITQDVFKASLRQTTLEDFVRTIQEQCLVLYPNRSIIMNYMPYSNTTPILIDQDGILQVLHNLINNAVKNSPQTSVVEITAVRYAREVKFTVQDCGVGISLLNFFQLFRPFTHLDTQYSVSGTGLGLYIVKSIVLAHGGSVEVHSKEHCGSSFTITLPLAER